MFGRDRVIQNVRTEGYLDGGSNHMRPKEHGTGNSGWISWRIIPQGNGSVLIQNVKTGGFLDGGNNHMRPWEHGTGNSGWISWRI